FAHKLLLGFDYQHIRTDTKSASRWGVSDFNLDTWDPDYDMGYELPPFTTDQRQKQYQTGLYLQDQIKLRGLSVLLRGRYDWARTTPDRSLLATLVRARGPQRAHGSTGRALVHDLFDKGGAPDFSSSQSCEPQSGTGWNNHPFDPVEGEQYELGVKYEP